MKRRGTVLMVALVITALSAMVAAGILYRMQAEVAASTAIGSGEQAYAAATSGLQRAIGALGDPSEDWRDNPDLFQNQLVCDDGTSQWYFTVYAANADHKTIRYGLEDEAGKINLNTADAQTLRNLFTRLTAAGQADELVDSLLDYRDSDSDTRAHGAEQDYYDKLKYPYIIRNGPLATLDEVLLIKGFTAASLYGEDANLNGILDPNEDDGDKTFPPDNADGQLDSGLYGMATVTTYERNVDSKGKVRIDLNGPTQALDGLKAMGLKDQTVQFIKTYRAQGHTFTHPSQLLDMGYTIEAQPGGQPTNNPGNGNATPPPGRRGRGGGAGGNAGGNTGGNAGGSTRGGRGGAGNGASGIDLTPGKKIKSEVDAEELPIILDKLTASRGGRMLPIVPGLVNVNTASVEVLSCLPGMDENLAQQIVDVRDSQEATQKSSIAWLYEQNLLDATKFKSVAPYLTAGSHQYRVRCIGFGVPSGRFRVIEAILDLAGSTPRIAYLRDITRLGLPTAMDIQKQEHKR